MSLRSLVMSCTPCAKRSANKAWEGIVNLVVLMQYQGKGETVLPLCFPQAARAGDNDSRPGCL
jgi:hypothetical protein